MFDFSTTTTTTTQSPSFYWRVNNYILNVSAYTAIDGQNIQLTVTLLTPLPTKRGTLCVEYDGYFTVELKYPFTMKHPDKLRYGITNGVKEFVLQEVKRLMGEVVSTDEVVFLPGNDGISFFCDVEDLPFLPDLKQKTFYVYMKAYKGTAYRYLGGNENFHINLRLTFLSKRKFTKTNPYFFLYDFCRKVVPRLWEVWEWLSVPENIASLYPFPPEVQHVKLVPNFQSAIDRRGPRYCGYIYNRGRKTTVTPLAYYDFIVKREVWEGFLYRYLAAAGDDVRDLASRLMFAYATCCVIPDSDVDVGEYLRVLSLIAEM